eukprot:scaffold11807_cov152-Ochromonas_danica.AAC.1
MFWMIFRTCSVLHNILLDYDGKDLVKIAERREAAGLAEEEDGDEEATIQAKEGDAEEDDNNEKPDEEEI